MIKPCVLIYQKNKKNNKKGIEKENINRIPISNILPKFLNFF